MTHRILSFVCLPALALAVYCCKPAKKSTATEAAPAAAPAVSAAPTGTAASEADVQMAIVQSRWPGSTAQDIKDGQVIYTTKCTSCHKAYSIPRFNEVKWLHEIDDMSPKANLSEAEKLSLTKYILSYRETKEKMAKGN